MDSTEVEFIMHKTTTTHPRINVAVEFVCDIGEKMEFEPTRGLHEPPEDRKHVLYLDRETWYSLDMPKTITILVKSRD